jgi:ZIP family zinc transporter
MANLACDIRPDKGHDNERVIAAFAWGLGAASSLLLGGVVSLRWPISKRVLGLVMAFGAGVLISAVAYDLVQEAFGVADGGVWIAIGLTAGAVTFYVGDALIDRMGGANRKSMVSSDQAQSPLAIVLGIVLDGIPESIVIGLTLLGGGVIDIAVVFAVFLSNVPEAFAATTGLRDSGYKPAQIVRLWVLVMLVSGLAAAVGFGIAGNFGGNFVALIDAFAAGAILTMLADTMIPEAYQFAGAQVGLATTLGFGLAFAISVL